MMWRKGLIPLHSGISGCIHMNELPRDIDRGDPTYRDGFSVKAGEKALSHWTDRVISSSIFPKGGFNASKLSALFL